MALVFVVRSSLVSSAPNRSGPRRACLSSVVCRLSSAFLRPSSPACIEPSSAWSLTPSSSRGPTSTSSAPTVSHRLVHFNIYTRIIRLSTVSVPHGVYASAGRRPANASEPKPYLSNERHVAGHLRSIRSINNGREIRSHARRWRFVDSKMRSDARRLRFRSRGRFCCNVCLNGRFDLLDSRFGRSEGLRYGRFGFWCVSDENCPFKVVFMLGISK